MLTVNVGLGNSPSTFDKVSLIAETCPFALLLTEKAAINFCALANKEEKILDYICIELLGQEIKRVILRRVRKEPLVID